MEGVVLLHKPKGMTSHDCIFKLRKILREKRIGHTGTLDPDVTGVLPICVGRATKIAQFLTSETKTYEGEVTLGFSTTTEDASGEVVETKHVDRVITRKEVEEVLAALTGTIEQMPPMFSAVKVNGKNYMNMQEQDKRLNVQFVQLQFMNLYYWMNVKCLKEKIFHSVSV